MKTIERLAIAGLSLLLLLLTTMPTLAATLVWLMYGLGGQWTSTGIDEIAARARTIPGVTQVNVRQYYDTQTVYNEASAAARAGHRVVIGGYSCGANASTVVARAMWQAGLPFPTVAVIQPSLWCGGDALEGASPRYGQSTYNADCAQTFGFGCKPLEAAPSFVGQIVLINRPDSHGYADNDPLAQDDVLKAIAATSLYGHRPALPPRPERNCRFAWTSERGAVAACTRTTRGGRTITVILRGNQTLRVR